jgi:hypothetical protein
MSEVEAYAATLGAPVFLTSAKTGDGVAEPFACIAERFADAPAGPSPHGRVSVATAGATARTDGGGSSGKSGGGCCGK